MTGSQVIVTGGCGFIGSHLVELLLETGHRVTVVDNLSTGKLSNLSSVSDNSDLEIKQVDVNDSDSLQEILSGVEIVFHLAALASIVPSIDNPLEYYRANVDGTVSVLEAARSAGVRRVVFAASSSCYGIPDSYPTTEDAPIRPEYPYALTKWLAEQTVLHWGQVYGIEVISLRLFNVYGPRARTKDAYGAVLGVFLAQKLAGQPLTIVGDGEQTRDFTYVTDVARAFMAAGDAPQAACRQVYNVGSGGTYSVNRLAGLIGGETVHVPKRPAEPDCTFADISRIQSGLGWSSSVDFEEGVARVMSDIENFQDAPVWTPETIADHTKTWFERLGAKSG